MLRSLKRRAEFQRKAGEIYGVIVTRARQPAFYAHLGIPDTPAGRYEMVVLHLFLVLERLRREGSSAETLARALIEAFVSDMDDAVREMGTGDVGVAKRVRRAVAGFYERSKDYREALAAGERQALELTLARHARGLGAADQRIGALSDYVRNAVASLADQQGANLNEGRISLPKLPLIAERVP